MQQITVTSEKKMSVSKRKEAMPYEVVADGIVIGVVKSFNDDEKTTVKTKCPNCGLHYDVTKPDGKPPYFTIRHD